MRTPSFPDTARFLEWNFSAAVFYSPDDLEGEILADQSGAVPRLPQAG